MRLSTSTAILHHHFDYALTLYPGRYPHGGL